MKLFRLLAALAVIAIPAAVAAPGFVSDKSHDYFGYYLPAHPVKLGPWRLRDLFIAPPADFRSFERGREPKTFSPVMLEFDDVTSPKKTNEMGNPYYTRDARVLAVGYSLNAAGRVHFEGKDRVLGAVTFDGGFVKDFARRKAASDGTSVLLNGTLTVGKRSFAVAFTWFGGD